MSRSVRSTAAAMADSLAPNDKPGNRGTAMHVTVVRHHAVDSPGFIGAAFEARSARLVTHLFPDGGPLPPLAGTDHLVVLGAIPSVYDDGPARGWIAEELAWLRRGGADGLALPWFLLRAPGGSVPPRREVAGAPP